MSIWQLCANLLIPNCLRSNLSYSPLAALELYVNIKYTLFYNDILGPMGFMISDSIIDIPAQFYHSWRYYWVVCYLYEMFWRWGIPSVIILLGYTIWIKWLKE